MNKSKIFWIWQPIIVFLLTGILAVVFARFGVDPHHDGIMFKPALDVALGKTLFRDTFTQYGALTTWLQASGIIVFGEYLLAIKLVTAFFYALASVSLWFVWREIMPTFLATLSSFIWIFLSPYLLAVTFPWSSVFALFFQILSTYFLILYVKNLRASWLIFAGLSAALTFWCRQPVGVFHYVALLLFITIWSMIRKIKFKRWLTEMSMITVGFFVTFFLFLAWITAHGALLDWWTQSIRFSLAFGEMYGKGFELKRLLSIFFPYPSDPNNAGYLWDIFPAACLFVFVQKIYKAFIKKTFSTKDTQVMALVIVALGSWHQYYPFPCFMHSFWAASPMIGILVYLLWSVFSKIKNVPIRMLATIIALIIIFAKDFRVRIPTVINYYHAPRVELFEPKILRGMKIEPAPAKIFSEISTHLNNYLKLHPNAVVINATTDALYMTFSDRMRNFHPAHVKWGLLQYVVYQDYQKSLLEYVARMRPLIFIYIPPDLKQSSENISKHNIFNGEELFEKYVVMFKTPEGLALIQPIDD